MLTQEGASYSYLMNDDFDPDAFTYVDNVSTSAKGLLGASMQTWSKAIASIDGNTRYDDPVNEIADRIYRKKARYSHIGLSDVSLQSDGSYPLAEFSELDPDGDWLAQVNNYDWQKNSEITLYDVHSHALEAKDVNGNYAATRFDSKNERVIGTVANASYDEFYVKNFDEESSSVVHSGLGAKEIPSKGGFDEQIPLRSGKYRASIWVEEQGVEALNLKLVVDGEEYPASFTTARKAGNWYLVEWYFTHETNSDISLSADNTTVGSIYLDDLRVHPVDATMTSYAYNDYGELSHVLDANNLYTHYQYDDMGRLKSVTRETLSHGPVEVSNADIHYGTGDISNINGSIYTERNATGDVDLVFDFSQKPPGSYSFEWKVNGVSIPGGERASFDIPGMGDYHITVAVSNTVTGQKFSAYSRKNLQQCSPEGTLISAICEQDSDGCRTGWQIKTFADGSCGTYEERIFNVAQCQNLIVPGGDAVPCNIIQE